MYFADSQGGFVWAWDFDPATGDIDNRRVFIDFRPTGGCADGATVDSEGAIGRLCRNPVSFAASTPTAV